MNKKIFWMIITLFTLTLTACASIAGTTGTAPNGGGSAGELPAQTKLILGTIKLEETENAVSAEQAAEIIPMFYVLQDLNESDTAAQEEINSLVSQIEETLTDEQTQAIDAMSLSRQDMFAITQGNSANTNSTEESTTGGGMGGPPEMGGGGMPGGGTTTASDDTGTRPAMDTSTPTALFDAIIKILEKKVQS